MKPFDDEILDFIQKRRIPGSSLAVFNNGRLVYANGYGFSDVDKKIRTVPTTLFRIASLSKPITAAGILKLYEQSKIDLDEPAVEFLKKVIADVDKKIVDKRWRKISVRHLLQHSGGWDSGLSGDPMFLSGKTIASGLNRSDVRVSPPDVVEYMLQKPLDFDPGTRYAYSNFGYCVLGRIIEAASGRRYEDYIRANVLAPLGIKKMRLGFTDFERRESDESVFYTRFNNPLMGEIGENANPYGSFQLERMDSHGGWVASSIEYARFCLAFSDGGDGKTRLFRSSTLKKVIERPSYLSIDERVEVYYGLGWFVRPNGLAGKPNLWHNGSLPGTYAFAAILGDGKGWVALFNGRSVDEKNLPNSAIDPALHRAAVKVGRLPEVDLWEKIKSG
jgi:N-acyl-D-amino-acid deacylase